VLMQLDTNQERERSLKDAAERASEAYKTVR
jgi:hypothetical protein